MPHRISPCASRNSPKRRPASDLEKATEDLERTVVRAPYDGMVREKRADVGQFVNTGTALALTFATDYAEVRLPLPQKDLRYVELPGPMVAKPLPVMLTADTGDARHVWQGRLVTALLRELSAELALLGVTSLYLFGSVARGDDDEHSDLDIAVRTVNPVDWMIDANARELVAVHLDRHVDLTILPFSPILAAEANEDLVQVL